MTDVSQTCGELSTVLDFWERIHASDAEFYVDDVRSCPIDAAMSVVREDCNYMIDYVPGDNGRIVQVRLDRVDS